MSQIEKETKWLSSEILPKILRSGRLLENYNDSKANTFHVGDIDIDVIGIDEAYMQTFCYRTTINFEYDGKKFQRKMVVKKTPPMPPDVYESIQFEQLFTNEINFYTEILPEIKKATGGKFSAPRYFYSELNQYSAVVILENFAVDGWRVTKDRVGLTLEHAMIAARHLGNFHGFSYALKHKNPEKFAKLTSDLKESRYANENMNPEWALTLKTSLKRVEKATETYQPQIEKEFVQKFNSLIADYFNYGKQRVAPREPLATLCHGDYVRNNVAYRYDDKDEPLEVMMFDYQTLRVSSPMIDLSVFLALALYADVRYPNLDDIFDEYVSELHDSYRREAHDDVPDSLSRLELIKEYVRFLPYSVSITSNFLAALVEPSDITVEEMIKNPPSEKEIIERTMTAGGELVDREIAHQIKEMLELSQLYEVPIDDGIDVNVLKK
ncbi:hypothetical protein KR067_013366 [Drosophila pandora]|nr:hypothetical protein KR067_013366 [Drosophila pandora]